MSIKIFHLIKWLSLSAFLVCFSSGHAIEADNQGKHLLRYFKGCEMQYELDAQREEIKQALFDLLDLPVQDIKRRRYKDYVGTPNQWTLDTLLNKYFLSFDENERLVSFEEHFFEELDDPQVKNQLRNLLGGFLQGES